MRPPSCPLPCSPQCEHVSDFAQQIAEHYSCEFACLFDRCRFRGETVVLAISGSPRLSPTLLFRLWQTLPLRPTAPARRLPPAALRCPRPFCFTRGKNHSVRIATTLLRKAGSGL